MIITQTRTIDYFEADPVFRVKLGVLIKRLQEAAVSHSESVGFGSRNMAGNKNAWILNRLGIDIIRWPAYLEPLTVTTWHRGSRGFMAYRDFRLSVEGEPVAVATSRWLFFDLGRKRVVKVPPETTAAYGAEDDRATDMDLDTWSPPAAPNIVTRLDISTRASDYDPNGHVNNAVYFDYLETLLVAETHGGDLPKRFLIQYQKEIPREVASISVGTGPGNTERSFSIWGDTSTYASGEIIFSPPVSGSV
ncbi:MAG: acyl-ACP thioesterase domain-containing protein [Pseudomonadota bacterium]